jgi:hypothetical protein
MAPDLPVRTRELTIGEAQQPLGSRLDDGFVIVDRGLAEAAKRGERSSKKARRRDANRSRARNRR